MKSLLSRTLKNLSLKRVNCKMVAIFLLVIAVIVAAVLVGRQRREGFKVVQFINGDPRAGQGRSAELGQRVTPIINSADPNRIRFDDSALLKTNEKQGPSAFNKPAANTSYTTDEQKQVALARRGSEYSKGSGPTEEELQKQKNSNRFAQEEQNRENQLKTAHAEIEQIQETKNYIVKNYKNILTKIDLSTSISNTYTNLKQLKEELSDKEFENFIISYKKLIDKYPTTSTSIEDIKNYMGKLNNQLDIVEYLNNKIGKLNKKFTGIDNSFENNSVIKNISNEIDSIIDNVNIDNLKNIVKLMPESYPDLSKNVFNKPKQLLGDIESNIINIRKIKASSKLQDAIKTFNNSKELAKEISTQINDNLNELKNIKQKINNLSTKLKSKIQEIQEMLETQETEKSKQAWQDELDKREEKLINLCQFGTETRPEDKKLGDPFANNTYYKETYMEYYINPCTALKAIHLVKTWSNFKPLMDLVKLFNTNDGTFKAFPNEFYKKEDIEQYKQMYIPSSEEFKELFGMSGHLYDLFTVSDYQSILPYFLTIKDNKTEFIRIIKNGFETQNESYIIKDDFKNIMESLAKTYSYINKYVKTLDKTKSACFKLNKDRGYCPTKCVNENEEIKTIPGVGKDEKACWYDVQTQFEFI